MSIYSQQAKKEKVFSEFLYSEPGKVEAWSTNWKRKSLLSWMAEKEYVLPEHPVMVSEWQQVFDLLQVGW